MKDSSAGGHRDKPRRVLDPVERISEVLFGLIMALTFTGSISISSDGQSEIRPMLVGAIGCNVAWGIVDAVIYLVTTLVERSRGLAVLHRVRAAASPTEAHGHIADAMPANVVSVLTAGDIETIRVRLTQLPYPPSRARLRWSDVAAATAVFLLVVVSTFPVVIPFIVIADVPLAMHSSNAITVLMLFTCGCSLGRYAGHRTLAMGLAMVAVGLTLIAVTIALGG